MKTDRDALGWTCFLIHIAVLAIVTLGWALPGRNWLIFYLVFLPADVPALEAQSRRLHPQQSGELAAPSPLADAAEQSAKKAPGCARFWPTPPASR